MSLNPNNIRTMYKTPIYRLTSLLEVSQRALQRASQRTVPQFPFQRYKKTRRKSSMYRRFPLFVGLISFDGVNEKKEGERSVCHKDGLPTKSNLAHGSLLTSWFDSSVLTAAGLWTSFPCSQLVKRNSAWVILCGAQRTHEHSCNGAPKSPGRSELTRIIAF